MLLRLWNPLGEQVGTLLGHTDEVQALCELSDGRLASAGRDNGIRLWNVAERKCAGNQAAARRMAEVQACANCFTQLSDHRVY